MYDVLEAQPRRLTVNLLHWLSHRASRASPGRTSYCQFCWLPV